MSHYYLPQQAVMTFDLPATNYRKRRVKATSQDDVRGVMVHYDERLSGFENHQRALKLLLGRLQLRGGDYTWVAGDTARGYAWVAIKTYEPPALTPEQAALRRQGVGGSELGRLVGGEGGEDEA